MGDGDENEEEDDYGGGGVNGFGWSHLVQRRGKQMSVPRVARGHHLKHATSAALCCPRLMGETERQVRLSVSSTLEPNNHINARPRSRSFVLS